MTEHDHHNHDHSTCGGHHKLAPPKKPQPVEQHDHSHDCGGHHHHHGAPTSKLSWVLALTALYMIVEFIGGLTSGSLALMADAGHMLGDVTAIAAALFAAWLVTRPAPKQHTFGYDRAETIAAFINGILLIFVALSILNEAAHRWQSAEVIQTSQMLYIAIGGLAINLFSAWLLHANQHDNLNLRGAYLHVIADALGSVGAIAASLAISQFGWLWADAVISAIIAVMVGYGALGLLKEAINILMESAPKNIHVDDLKAALLSYEGVQGVHNLHVWHIGSAKIVMAAHIIVRPDNFSAELLSKLQTLIKTQFGLAHVTLQLETDATA